jgi:hypothetical protein
MPSATQTKAMMPPMRYAVEGFTGDRPFLTPCQKGARLATRPMELRQSRRYMPPHRRYRSYVKNALKNDEGLNASPILCDRLLWRHRLAHKLGQ